MPINLDPLQFVTKSPPLPQIRMGLMGPPGSGKTTAVVNTFPSVVVIDYDKKLPPGINKIDITNPEIERQFVDPKIPKVPGDARTSLRNFLEHFAVKFSPETILLLDSWTSMMNRMMQWQDDVKETQYWSQKKGEVDGWAIYDDLILYGIEITNYIKALPCHVVITFHEQVHRNEKGNVTGIKPLMRGQFADQIAAHLTTFFRCGFSKALADKDAKKYNNGYVWKVKADDEFKPITPPGFKAPDDTGYLPATYQDYLKCFIKPSTEPAG